MRTSFPRSSAFLDSGPGAPGYCASGAVLRLTSVPVLTPPASGGRGGLEPSGRWSSFAPPCGGAPGAWVPAPSAAEECRTDDDAEDVQAPCARPHGEDR